MRGDSQGSRWSPGRIEASDADATIEAAAREALSIDSGRDILSTKKRRKR
jgi:hypothetical protein